MGRESYDRDVERYRNLLEEPTDFKEGFGWTTVTGIFFCGLVMMPGGIYLGLMSGIGLNLAASWVTVILFMEIARRTLKPLSKQNLVILLHAAHIIMLGHALFPGGPMSQLVYRAYVVGSETVRDQGMTGIFPSWWAPSADSKAITERTLLHKDWLAPIALLVFTHLIGLVKRYTLGYFFFRLTSDVENLPFPMAPVKAQGAMALAESDMEEEPPAQETGKKRRLSLLGSKKGSLRWRIFTLGLSLGVAFGFFQVGVPALSSLFLTKAFYLIPQPFVDTTTLTEVLLPATPTGMSIDLGVIIMGFVLPFWSVVGAFIAIVITMIMNPILHHLGVLTLWQPGMNTVNTAFSNNIDFWLSFTIGSAFGIASVCIFATFRDVRAKMAEAKKNRKARTQARSIWEPPHPNRGDYPVWLAVVIYCFAAGVLVAVCAYILRDTRGALYFLLFFAFIYNPFISYVNARLLGISGQSVEIPHVKEAVFLLSGARGIDIWLAPVPLDHFGEHAQQFRVNELTGVRFWSLLKTDLVATPVLLILSLTFWGFIWKSEAIPSDMFPAASIQWELNAKNQVLLWSSTTLAEDQSIMDSEFMEAIHPAVIGGSFLSTVILYTVLSIFGLPVMLIYGMMRGFGQLPHVMMLEIVGALLARFYFQKKYGFKKFRQNSPILLAGYMTGVGLIGMITIAMKLIKISVSGAPF